MPRTSVMHQHALQLLRDGYWHDYNEVLRDLMEHVPPHKAAHEAERARIDNWRKTHPDASPNYIPPRKKRHTMDQQIQTGARMIANEILRNAAYEVAKNPETGAKIIRLYNPENSTQLPPGFVLGKSRKAFSAYYGMSKEEREKLLSQRSRNAARARLIKRGLDPDTYVTIEERNRRRKEEIANMTPEQLKAFRAEAARKSWETRKKNLEKKAQEEGKLMGHRYRLVIDVCEESERGGGEFLGIEDLKEIHEAVTSAAKVAIPARVKKSVRVEKVMQRKSVYHEHEGNSTCNGCLRMADDGMDGDLSSVFPPLTVS